MGTQQLAGTLASGTGSFVMKDSEGRNCVVAYTPLIATEGWILLSYLPEADLRNGLENWLLIGIIAAGLVALFLFDLFCMLYFNRRLQVMAAEAESANRAKTDFLSTMSHDIRTPMNAIIGLTVLSERNLGDAEAVGENLRKIGLASNHLLTLINDILDISKVESGKLTLSPVTFSIVETVENLVNLSQPMIKEKNIDFSFRINRMEKEYLYADQLRLNQIYINILSNAIKYTEPEGRVSVDMMRDAEEGRYALIFMDVQMPEMNGLDATRNIRALDNRWASEIPIIAMTADAFSENVTECLNAGMNGHIAKPVDIKLVIKEIRRINERGRRS